MLGREGEAGRGREIGVIAVVKSAVMSSGDGYTTFAVGPRQVGDDIAKRPTW